MSQASLWKRRGNSEQHSGGGKRARNDFLPKKSSGEVCPWRATCSDYKVLLHGSVCFPAILLPGMKAVRLSQSQHNLRLSGAKTRTSAKPPVSIIAALPAPAGCGRHLSREWVQRAGKRQELGLDFELPHHSGALSLSPDWELALSTPSDWGVPRQQGLCLPQQVKVSLSTEIFFSLSLWCEERQRVPTMGEGVALSVWALYFFHHAIV